MKHHKPVIILMAITFVILIMQDPGFSQELIGQLSIKAGWINNGYVDHYTNYIKDDITANNHEVASVEKTGSEYLDLGLAFNLRSYKNNFGCGAGIGFFGITRKVKIHYTNNEATADPENPGNATISTVELQTLLIPVNINILYRVNFSEDVFFTIGAGPGLYYFSNTWSSKSEIPLIEKSNRKKFNPGAEAFAEININLNKRMLVSVGIDAHYILSQYNKSYMATAYMGISEKVDGFYW